jgi:hypothetical protein
MTHLTPEQLGALHDAALDAAEAANARRHVAECAACRAELATLAAADDALRAGLGHDPGEAYFASFAARVQGRIRERGVVVGTADPFADALDDEAEAPAAPAHDLELPRHRRRMPEPWLERAARWLTGSRLAWAGAAAAVVVAAGIVFQVSREGPMEVMRDPAIASRTGSATEAAPPPSVPAPTATAPVDELATEEVAPEPASPPQRQLSDASRASARAGAAPPTIATQRAAAPDADAAAPTRAPDARAREMKRGAGEDVPATADRGAPAPGTATTRANANESIAERVRRAKQQAARPLAESATPEAAKSGFAAPPAAAQELRMESSGPALCGTVRDASGRPLEGAQVAIADLGATARTDARGRYCVAAPPGTHTLTVMAVGFRDVRLEVESGPNEGEHDVTLAAVSVVPEPMAGNVEAPWPAALRVLAGAAERASASAARTNTAAAYDLAALQWNGVVGLARSGAGAARARRELAEVRWLAHERGPTPERARAAEAALRSYLEVAPAGAERRAAEARLRALGAR